MSTLTRKPVKVAMLAKVAYAEHYNDIGRMNALAAAHDFAVRMIDTSIVRVHQMARVL